MVATADAPRPVGPYSQAVIVGDLVYTVGVVGNDPTTSRLVEGGIEAQADRAVRNLAAILEAGGSGPDAVLKATVYLGRIADEPIVLSAWSSRMGPAPPACTVVEVAGMPLGAAVELECVALVGRPETRSS